MKAKKLAEKLMENPEFNVDFSPETTDMKIMTDLDLPEAHRTQANFWKAKYFEARRELVRANKGIRRLRHKLDRRLTPDAADVKSRFVVAPNIELMKASIKNKHIKKF